MVGFVFTDLEHTPFIVGAEMGVAGARRESRMLKDRSSIGISERICVRATAFRDDRSAERVTLTNLSFDGCEVSSGAAFAVGERLRLHLRGQGLIETQVEWCSGDRAGVTFLTTSKV